MQAQGGREGGTGSGRQAGRQAGIQAGAGQADQRGMELGLQGLIVINF